MLLKFFLRNKNKVFFLQITRNKHVRHHQVLFTFNDIFLFLIKKKTFKTGKISCFISRRKYPFITLFPFISQTHKKTFLKRKCQFFIFVWHIFWDYEVNTWGNKRMIATFIYFFEAERVEQKEIVSVILSSIIFLILIFLFRNVYFFKVCVFLICGKLYIVVIIVFIAFILAKQIM